VGCSKSRPHASTISGWRACPDHSALPPDTPNLDATLAAIADEYRYEFLVSPLDHQKTPELVAALVFHGFLPMGGRMYSSQVLFPKIHHKRCIVRPADVHVPKKVLKRAKEYRLSVDQAWQEVVRLIVRHTYTYKSGDNWLSSGLVATYERVATLPSSLRRGVCFHSIELWHVASDNLVAGEIGCTAGGVFTSLTGFCLKEKFSGSGMVQLIALAALLRRCGFMLWDLGMEMPYKLELGARSVPRAEWLRQQRVLRELGNIHIYCLVGGEPAVNLLRCEAQGDEEGRQDASLAEGEAAGKRLASNLFPCSGMSERSAGSTSAFLQKCTPGRVDGGDVVMR